MNYEFAPHRWRRPSGNFERLRNVDAANGVDVRCG
jgi:hypothetical protein